MSGQACGSAEQTRWKPREFAKTIRLNNPRPESTQGKFGRWSNIDLDPTPPEQRTWNSWSFFAFQFSIAFSPTTYNVGASLYAIGLNWWTILIASIVVSVIVAILLYLNSRGATWYHVGFPTIIRSSAGIYGSLAYIGIRGVVAVLYTAIQTLYASQFMAVMLRCVFGHRWTDIPNRLPSSAGITSANLLAFGILWLLQLPFAFIHPSRINIVFRIKSVLAPIGLIATMIWALVRTKKTPTSTTSEAATGAALGWSFMKALNTIVSNVIPPLVNIADLSRYGSRPSQTIPMPVGLVISKPLVTFLGMVITAAGYKQFGEAYWNLWDFYSSVLDNYWGPEARTLIFLAAGIQAFATFATNLSSNSIPVGSDLAGLFPRYFTIVRGQILCFLLVWVCVPWKLTYSAASFLTFLGSYLCFICPIVACMIVDYWLIRNGNLHVPSLYSTKPESPYYYFHGFNLRAFGSWAAAVVLVVPGVSGNLHPGSIGTAAVRIYNMGFLLSSITAGLLYYASCKVWPVQIYPPEWNDQPKTREFMRHTEGFFTGEEMYPVHLLDTSTIVGEALPEKMERSREDDDGTTTVQEKR
ncbi:allantoin transport [Colletotrichum karsti]|uniref:Allantoin transport n=1 Tax=Colletotrichum karsti TaxID=1095194 RepID=A0A9P6LJF6_9PEZI|nr:allantoin transport [Colletotrichum karsti]KAF9875176.1 allantoin transport [Colletotrichum karsti]